MIDISFPNLILRQRIRIMRKSCLFALILFIVITPMAFAADKPALGVTLSIDKASLKTDVHKSTGQFFVDATITNTSSKEQRFVVWTQRGWSFLSDNLAISPGIEAEKNFPATIILKPAQYYKMGVEVFADPHQSWPVTFRLGFYPNAIVPISSSLHKPAAADIIWSNPVTLP